MSFTTATVRLGELVFEDVAGSVGADGIAFSSGWLDLPDGWWSDLPPRLRIAPPSAGAFAAPLGDDGAWGAMRAQIALDDGVELLPLPEGWTFPSGQSTLAYVPAEQRFALRSVAQAAGGENGRVTLDGSIRLDGTTTVSVAADRLVVLHGVDDRTVALSGVGTLTTDPSAADDEQKADGDERPPRPTTTVTPRRALRPHGRRRPAAPRAAHFPSGGDGTLTGSLTLRAEGELALTSNVSVSDVTARWDADGIAVASGVRVSTARDDFEAVARGEYVSTSQWKLTLQQTRAFGLGDGVTLDEVEGSLERAPGEDDHDTFQVSVVGSVHGWSPSGPAEERRHPRRDHERLHERGERLLDETGAARDGGHRRRARRRPGRAVVRHRRRQPVDLRGQIRGRRAAGRLRPRRPPPDRRPPHADHRRPAVVQARPAAPMSDADHADATAPAADAPADAPATLESDQELAFGVSARGRLLGEAFTADGEFARSGYCITGSFGSFTPDGLPAGEGRAPLVDQVRFAYASKAADVVVAGKTMRLGAGDVRLSGVLNLPEERLPEGLGGVLGGKADLALALTRGEGGYGLSGAALFSFARPVNLIGERPQDTRLGLTSVELSFDYSAGTSLRLEMAAKGALETPANVDRGVAASRTPLFVAAGVELGAPSVSLSAGVDVSDPALKNGTVQNAFGQQGLDVRRLLVSASVGVDTSFGIAADATLPDGWTDSLGMPKRTPAKVAFSVSQTNACLELEVGQLPAVLGGPGSPQPVLEARPAERPTGRRSSSPRPAARSATPRPASPATRSTRASRSASTARSARRRSPSRPRCASTARPTSRSEGTVRVGAFDAGPVSFRRTALDLDIDTGGANRHVDVAFSGGLDAGESTIDVEGRFNANDTAISAALRGSGRLRFAGTTFAEGAVLGEARVRQGEGLVDGAQRPGRRAHENHGRRGRPAAVLRRRLGQDRRRRLPVQRDGRPARRCAPARCSPTRPTACGSTATRTTARSARLAEERGGKELMLRLCSAMRLGPLSYDKTLNLSLPQQWDFDFVVPRSEVGVYVASVYMQGELRSSLRVGLNGLNFWVRSGSARAGGCVSMLWWTKCADGVNVCFNPNSGKLRGLVHRHPGQLGLRHVALEPGPGGRADGAAGRRRRPRRRRPCGADRVRDARERRRRRQTDGLRAGEGRRAAGRRDPRPGPQRGLRDAAAAGDGARGPAESGEGVPADVRPGRLRRRAAAHESDSAAGRQPAGGVVRERRPGAHPRRGRDGRPRARAARPADRRERRSQAALERGAAAGGGADRGRPADRDRAGPGTQPQRRVAQSADGRTHLRGRAVRSRTTAALIGAATIGALGALGAAAGGASAASSSPFACDQPDWAGGAAMRLTIAVGRRRRRSRCRGRASRRARRSRRASRRSTARSSIRGRRPARGSSSTSRATRSARTVYVDFSAEGVPGRERVLVDVRGASAGPNVVAIGDSVTAAFGYCGIADVCGGVNSAVENSWLSLKDCNQEAEYPKLPQNLCSNNRRNGLPWTNDGETSGGVAYPMQFGWWLRRATQKASFVRDPSVRNWAVSGARPAHWDPTPVADDPTNKDSTPGGFSGQTKKIDDSLVVMTLGANKLLADFLSFDFAWPMSWFADTTGDYAKCTGARGWFWGYEEAGKARLKRCFEEDWAVNKQAEHLKSVYGTLLAQGDRVLVLGYHLACPSTFGTWQQMSFSDGPAGGKTSACTAQKGDNGMSQFDQAMYVSGLLNDAIRDAVESTRSWARATWPGEGRDSRIAFVDTAALDDWTQHQTWSGEKWVFPNDTGIHPSRAGHAVMAKNVAVEACALLGLYCVQNAALDPGEFQFPGRGARAASAGGSAGSAGSAGAVGAVGAVGATSSAVASAVGAERAAAGAPRAGAVRGATVVARVGTTEITAAQVRRMGRLLGDDARRPASRTAAEALKTLITGAQVRAEARRLGIAIPSGAAVTRRAAASPTAAVAASRPSVVT